MMGYVCTLYNAYMTDDMRYGRNFKSKIEKYNDWFSGVDWIDPDQTTWIDIPQIFGPDHKYRLGGTLLMQQSLQ